MSPLFKPCFIMLCKKHTKPSSMYCLKSYCFFSSLCGLLCFKSKIYENYCPKLWNICYIYYVNLCAALPEQITTSQWLSTTRITGGIRLPPKGCKYVGRGSLGLFPFFLQYPISIFPRSYIWNNHTNPVRYCRGCQPAPSRSLTHRKQSWVGRWPAPQLSFSALSQHAATFNIYNPFLVLWAAW